MEEPEAVPTGYHLSIYFYLKAKQHFLTRTFFCLTVDMINRIVFFYYKSSKDQNAGEPLHREELSSMICPDQRCLATRCCPTQGSQHLKQYRIIYTIPLFPSSVKSNK